jgi:hypothetical protein
VAHGIDLLRGQRIDGTSITAAEHDLPEVVRCQQPVRAALGGHDNIPDPNGSKQATECVGGELCGVRQQAGGRRRCGEHAASRSGQAASCRGPRGGGQRLSDRPHRAVEDVLADGHNGGRGEPVRLGALAFEWRLVGSGTPRTESRVLPDNPGIGNRGQFGQMVLRSGGTAGLRARGGGRLRSR